MESVAAKATETTLEFDEMVRDTRAEALFTDWGLPFELEPQFPLLRLKLENATQIRVEEHRAPSETVDQYTIHMKHGAAFPPIVVASTGMLVDGNTRVAACKNLNLKVFPAYKVKFPHLGIAKMIGAALNQMGGDRLSDEEIITAAEVMMAEGYADEAIARTLGRSVSHVRNVRKDRSFRAAAMRTGVEHVALASPARRTLANVSHDEPFKAAVEAVAEHRPPQKEIAALVEKIEDTRSDAEAVAVINAVKAQWGPVTGPPPGKKSLSRSKAKQAIKHVRALVELAEPNPADVVLPDDAEAAEQWARLGSVVTQVCALYVKS